MRTLIIGRSRGADIILTDKSVAPRHAELVLTDDGKCYLTDCASGGGSWIQVDQEWAELRQSFVTKEQRIRFGDHECDLPALLATISRRRNVAGVGVGGGEGGEAGTGQAGTAPLTGTVERDPVTGEIVRKRP